MPYIPPSVVQEVKRMDLLTYLKNYEPCNSFDRWLNGDEERERVRAE